MPPTSRAAPFPTSSRQQTALSASEQLQLYIDQFDRSQASAQSPAMPALSSLTPSLHHQTDAKRDESDAWDLLCGRGSTAAGHVSVKTRRILRDVDRQLGHAEPCYSAQEKLNLRSFWPSMHEHLERRWRQQIRERYEAQQRAEAAAAAIAAEASSRAGLYKYSRMSSRQIRLRKSETPSPTAPARVRDGDSSSDNDSDGAGGSGGSSLAVGPTVAARRSSDERYWGSDSGIGQSCHGATAASQTAGPTAAVASAHPPDTEAADDLEADKSEVSFEERMRSYRCVLEAHELSSRLRQHLEAACASVGTGGKRVLSVEDKGRIRDRLARLQGPLRGGFTLPDEDKQKPEQQQQQQQPEAERITTERLSKLMSSVHSLLTQDGEAESSRDWLGGVSKQRPEPKQALGDEDFEANQEPADQG